MGKCESANFRSYDLSSVLKVECKSGSGFLAFKTKIKNTGGYRSVSSTFWSQNLYTLNLLEDSESFLCGAYVTSIHIYLAIKTEKNVKIFMNSFYDNKPIIQ